MKNSKSRSIFIFSGTVLAIFFILAQTSFFSEDEQKQAQHLAELEQEFAQKINQRKVQWKNIKGETRIVKSSSSLEAPKVSINQLAELKEERKNLKIETEGKGELVLAHFYNAKNPFELEKGEAVTGSLFTTANDEIEEIVLSVPGQSKYIISVSDLEGENFTYTVQGFQGRGIGRVRAVGKSYDIELKGDSNNEGPLAGSITRFFSFNEDLKLAQKSDLESVEYSALQDNTEDLSVQDKEDNYSEELPENIYDHLDTFYQDQSEEIESQTVSFNQNF